MTLTTVAAVYDDRGIKIAIVMCLLMFAFEFDFILGKRGRYFREMDEGGSSSSCCFLHHECTLHTHCKTIRIH